MYLLVVILMIIALAVLYDLWGARHRRPQRNDTTRPHEEEPPARWLHRL
jgi:hypothetical protein